MPKPLRRMGHCHKGEPGMLESTLNNNTRIARRARLTGYMKSLMASVIALLVSMPAAYATYNANLSGTVNAVLTYTSGALLFSLSNQPTSNGSCNSIASDKEHQPRCSAISFLLHSTLRSGDPTCGDSWCHW